MKLTTILLIAATMHVSAAGNAQKVTLNVSNVPLKTVFVELNKQTGYNFLYSDEVLAGTATVTIKVKNVPVEDVLNLAFMNQPLEFSMINNTIVVKPKSQQNNEHIEQIPIDVTGKVTDQEGNPLVGATVKIRGTNIGTTTNLNGVFVLKEVNEDAILEISYTEHETLILELKNRTSIVVTLKSAVTRLQEVVVNKGYYSERQRLSVGNVGQVTAKEIEKQPVNNPLLALYGRVPGLHIVQNTGVPGSGVNVRIQGRNNISPSSGGDPLYVIDGVPYISQMLSTFTGGPSTNILGKSGSGAGNPLNYINAADIESIEILKDADATAIYGSRAANGAILITTKKGKVGKTKINFNLQTGIGRITRKLDLLNTQQYIQMRKEAYKNEGITSIPASAYDLTVWDTTRYTDWQDELIGGSANYNQVTAGITGGSQNMQYLVSGTYNDQTTVFPTDFKNQRSSIHFNLHGTSPNNKLNIHLTGNYLIDNNHLPIVDFTLIAQGLAPNAPALRNPDGSLNWAPESGGWATWDNPLSITLRKYEAKTTNLLSNMNLNYRINDYLDIKSNFGYSNLMANEFQGFPLEAEAPEIRPYLTRNAWYTNSNSNTWIIEPQLNFNRIYNFGQIEFLLGSTIQQRNSDGTHLQGSGYNSDQVLENIQAATKVQVNGTENSIYRYNAAFARLNYNWQDKYIVNLTGRRDGSSRFGSKNKFHSFWGVGAAWIFTEERFLQNQFFLSFGKIKGSFGTSGNDQIGDYRFLNLYSQVSPAVPYQGTNGLTPDGLPNPYIQWEETKKLHLGVELGFLRDRILVSSTYSKNKSSNQILHYVLPSITGFGGIIENFPATVENTSWEFTANAAIIKSSSLSWDTKFNLTIPKNEVVDFTDYDKSPYASGDLGVIPGHSIGIQKLYQFSGVDQATGIYNFCDRNGNVTTTPTNDDRIVLVNNSIPKLYGGLHNSIGYKNLNFDFLFQFSNQTGIKYLYKGIPGRFGGGVLNQPVYVLNRWQKPGDITNVQRFSSNTSLLNSYFNVIGSDIAQGDASYIRLKNLSLSWTLPAIVKEKLHIHDFKIYVQGQNLFTITNFQGMDPENATFNPYSLPPLKIFTIGLQLTL